MTKFTIIALVVGPIGNTSAAVCWFLAGYGGHLPNLCSDEQCQKTREFFAPVPQRDLRRGQEMRPQW